MLKPILCTAALLLTQLAHAAPGYKTTTLDMEHRDQPVDIHIWYPSETSNEPELLGKNIVFKGVEVYPDAQLLEGPHPLIVLSHGSGGNAANLAWIAASLADRGMIVIAPNHQGTTSRDSHPLETIKIWERPADMTAILDEAIKNGFGFLEIDTGQIGAAGFSLGGYTTMALGGAQADQAKYITYCDTYKGMHDCGWLENGGVDFTKIDTAQYEQSNHDPRIKAIVAIDPAIAQAYQNDSLAAISIPTLIINLGQDAPAAINATNMMDHLQTADIEIVKGASHFSFLGECTRMGAAIIKMENEDPICSDAGDRPRNSIHEELKAHIGRFFAKHLQM